MKKVSTINSQIEMDKDYFDQGSSSDKVDKQTKTRSVVVGINTKSNLFKASINRNDFGSDQSSDSDHGGDLCYSPHHVGVTKEQDSMLTDRVPESTDRFTMGTTSTVSVAGVQDSLGAFNLRGKGDADHGGLVTPTAAFGQQENSVASPFNATLKRKHMNFDGLDTNASYDISKLEMRTEKNKERDEQKKLKQSRDGAQSTKESTLQQRSFSHQKDTKEFLAAEKKKNEKRQDCRRIGLQLLTMSIAMAKLYTITIVQGAMTLFNSSFPLY